MEKEEAESNEINWQDEAQVMSDVHVGCSPNATSCTTIFTIGNKSRVLETYYELENEDDVTVNNTDITCDDSGDLILQRRHKRHRSLRGESVTIHHQLTTRLPGVGLQIWRGAMLLADFILDSPSLFQNVTAIELGAGTGLAGIVMARAAKRVFITGQFATLINNSSVLFCTDRGADILDNCTRNVLVNSNLYAHGDGVVQVRELDWLQPWPPRASHEDEGMKRDESSYIWSEKDVEDARNASVLLAADVVYSPELTQAFFDMLDKIMTFGATKTLFLTMEKRYNFSINELDVVANGYKQFRSYFHTRDSDSNMGETQDMNGMEWKFDGRQISTEQVQQHVVEYERGKDLELWEITRREVSRHNGRESI